MKLLLICNTPIIEHIFSLVCKRLNILLTVQKTNDVLQKYDFIIIDQPFLDNTFSKIKKMSLRLGVISAEELSFDKPRDFLIPRPFLPTKLEAILKDEISIFKEEQKNIYTPPNFIEDSEDYEIVTPLTDFINDDLDDTFFETLLDDELEDDESIVSLSALKQGGVLDTKELNKINLFLDDDKPASNELNESDWKDIGEIIDDAIEEVKEYEFDLNSNKYSLVLSKFKIEELKPLLVKLDQTIIDRLTKGESIDIKISMKE